MNTLLRLSPVGSSGGKWRVDSDPPKTVGALTRAQIDLWSVANGLFGCETLVRTNKKVEGIEIPLYLEYDSRLQSTLEAMLRFIVEQPIEVAFTQNSKSIQSTLIPETVEPFSEGYACLFSTGLDSYSVFLNAAIEFKDLTACFVDHNDFRKLRALSRTFSEHLKTRTGTSLQRVHAPDHGSYMRRSRGVFYVMAGLLLGKKNLIVGETGVTMYQPKFTLLDRITVTTHPKLLQMTGLVTKEILGEKPRIIRPSENMTKAEIAACCPDKESIKLTFSCSTTRFATEKDVANCGTCFACIVRRFAVLVSGVEDCDYAHRIASISAIDNAVQLLRFSIDFLSNREAIPWYTREIVESYEKTDLFERFAQDNLAGLMLESERGSVNPVLTKIREVGKRAGISDNMLRERINIVRTEKTKMNFSNIL
jgi:hypothetical protein